MFSQWPSCILGNVGTRFGKPSQTQQLAFSVPHSFLPSQNLEPTLPRMQFRHGVGGGGVTSLEGIFLDYMQLPLAFLGYFFFTYAVLLPKTCQHTVRKKETAITDCIKGIFHVSWHLLLDDLLNVLVGASDKLLEHCGRREVRSVITGWIHFYDWGTFMFLFHWSLWCFCVDIYLSWDEGSSGCTEYSWTSSPCRQSLHCMHLQVPG